MVASRFALLLLWMAVGMFANPMPRAEAASARVAFLQKEDHQTFLYLTDVQKKEVTRLLRTSDTISSLLSAPNGKWIAYEVQNPEEYFPSLWLVNTQSKKTQKLLDAQKKPHLTAWLNAQTLLITLQGDKGKQTLVQFNLHTENYHKITELGSTYLLSPNKKQVLMQLTTSDYRIGLIGTDGSHFQELTTGGREYAPAWSPDGKQIAYADDHGIWVLRLADRKVWQVAKQGENPFWLPDGKHLLFEEMNNKNERSLWKVSWQGGTPKRITRGMQPILSPNGKWVLFRYSFDIGFFPVSGEWTQYITYNGQNARWSPDGKHIVFEKLHREGPGKMGKGMIAVYTFDSKKARPLSSQAAYLPVWVP